MVTLSRASAYNRSDVSIDGRGTGLALPGRAGFEILERVDQPVVRALLRQGGGVVLSYDGRSRIGVGSGAGSIPQGLPASGFIPRDCEVFHVALCDRPKPLPQLREVEGRGACRRR